MEHVSRDEYMKVLVPAYFHIHCAHGRDIAPVEVMLGHQ
jgi:hypothetical protein